ncbi:hypothetical protein QR680_009117 [Steinernema hermaphroditum]|uniref:Histone-lysine N-methyltransferase n=1 Tax=Steinernema hermaphroditum TaxID=289476 RepID=A0AA39IJ55_9BILA|nr:hypothetical protein QR680_009117 [Steinernema hermaphroditum]
MNFEAVPCMFKQTVDGNESSYVGLLIRPSTQASSASSSSQTATYQQPIAAAKPQQNPPNGQTSLHPPIQSCTTSPSGNYAAVQPRRSLQAATSTSGGCVNTNNAFYSQKQLQPRPSAHAQQEHQAPYMQHQLQQQACTSTHSVSNCSTAGGWTSTHQAQQPLLGQQPQMLQQQQLVHQQQGSQWSSPDFERASSSSWGASYSAEARNHQWKHNGNNSTGHLSQLTAIQLSPIAHQSYPSSQWDSQQPSTSQQPASAKRRNSKNHSTPQVPQQISRSSDAFSATHHSRPTGAIPSGALPPISSITRQSPLKCSSSVGPSSTPMLGHYSNTNAQSNGYAGYPPSTLSENQNFYGQQQQHSYHQNQLYHQQRQQQQHHHRIQPPPQYPQMQPSQQQHFPQQMSSGLQTGYPAANQHQWISPLPANSSATPDSGIQSIGDSPHSTNPYTPPIVSPYTQQMASVEEREKALPPSLDANEYADMPKLMPMNQMEELPEEDDFEESGPPNIAGIPDCTTASPLVEQTSCESTPCTPKCASATPSVEIHAGMNTKEVTQQLVLTFGEQRIKEMAQLLHSQSNKIQADSSTPAPDSTTSGEVEHCGVFASPAPSDEDFCASQETPTTIVEQKPDPKIDEEALREKDKAEARRRLLQHRKNVREKTRRTFDRLLENFEDDWSGFSLGEFTPREKPVFASLDWSAVSSRLTEMKEKKAEKESRKRKYSLADAKTVDKKTKPGRKRRLGSDAGAGKYEAAPFTIQSTSSKKSASERRASASKKTRVATSERPQGHDYQKIRSNTVVDAPQRMDDSEPCECDAQCFCSEKAKCFHRERRIECTPSNCTLHNVCLNRRIYNNQTITDLVKSTKADESMCLRTGVDIHRGEYVCEYVGEVVSRARFEARFASEYGSWRHHYAMALTPDFVVDAYRRGNISRFINHSCKPNCVTQTWLVNGIHRLGIFAAHEIQAGEELTIDYAGVHVSPLNPPQKCLCGTKTCRGFIVPPPGDLQDPESSSTKALSPKQRKLVNSKQLFLFRNLRRKERNPKATFKTHAKEKTALWRILNDVVDFGVKNDCFTKRRVPQIRYKVLLLLRHTRKSCPTSELVERFEAVFRTELDIATCSSDRRRAESLRTYYASLKKASEFFRNISKNTKEKVMPSKTDLSYMDSTHLVGSYNPDESTIELAATANPDEQDVVRCICGILDEDGTMVQCDCCHFWLHSDCLGKKQPKDNDDFTCRFCEKELRTTPAVDIVLRPQPDIRLEGCVYYRTLVNSRGIQVRINETVYVERLPDDKHKAALKKLHECVGKSSKLSKKDAAKKAAARPSVPVPPRTNTFERRDLRIFRVERLFRGPNDEPFVFGCYYARPHETFCDSTRLFYKNELFWTPLFDTLPLEAVVGRCLVLEPTIFVEGRPKLPKYREDDVFICEYQIDKQQRSFEKINSKNRYYINTQPYVFDRFKTPLQPKRNFTPFLVGSNRAAEKSEAKEKRDITVRKLSADRLSSIVHLLSKSLPQRNP